MDHGILFTRQPVTVCKKCNTPSRKNIIHLGIPLCPHCQDKLFMTYITDDEIEKMAQKKGYEEIRVNLKKKILDW